MLLSTLRYKYFFTQVGQASWNNENKDKNECCFMLLSTLRYKYFFTQVEPQGRFRA